MKKKSCPRGKCLLPKVLIISTNIWRKVHWKTKYFNLWFHLAETIRQYYEYGPYVFVHFFMNTRCPLPVSLWSPHQWVWQEHHAETVCITQCMNKTSFHKVKLIYEKLSRKLGTPQLYYALIFCVLRQTLLDLITPRKSFILIYVSNENVRHETFKQSGSINLPDITLTLCNQSYLRQLGCEIGRGIILEIVADW